MPKEQEETRVDQKEAAERLGVHVNTVAAMLDDGRLEAIEVGGAGGNQRPTRRVSESSVRRREESLDCPSPPESQAQEENWFSTAQIARGKPEGPWISLAQHQATVEKERRAAYERGDMDASNRANDLQARLEEAVAQREDIHRQLLSAVRQRESFKRYRDMLLSPYCKDKTCRRPAGGCDHPKLTWQEVAERDGQAALDRRGEGRADYLRAERAEAGLRELAAELDGWLKGGGVDGE